MQKFMFREIFCLLLSTIIGNVFLYSSQLAQDHFVDLNSLKSRQIYHEFIVLDDEYSLVRADVDDEIGLKIKESRKNLLEKNAQKLDENLSTLRIYNAIKNNPLPVQGSVDYIFGLFSVYKHQGEQAKYIGQIFVDACNSPSFYSDGIVNLSFDIANVSDSIQIENYACDCIFQKVLAPNLGKNLPVLRYDQFRLGLIRNMYTLQWCMPISRHPLLGVVRR